MSCRQLLPPCVLKLFSFKDVGHINYIIQNWMRNCSTIKFIGLWEQIHNPNFKSLEFDALKT